MVALAPSKVQRMPPALLDVCASDTLASPSAMLVAIHRPIARNFGQFMRFRLVEKYSASLQAPSQVSACRLRAATTWPRRPSTSRVPDVPSGHFVLAALDFDPERRHAARFETEVEGASA